MNNSHLPNPRIAFWGTSRFSVFILEEMARESNSLPALIITAPPKPKGRGLELAPSEVKVWADAHGIPTLEPKEIKSEDFLNSLKALGHWDMFVVASYGKIIPRAIIDLPTNGTLNVHPSLLPALRGPSPIQSAILEDAPIGETHESGVTIMLIDEQVDHGAIVAQEKMTIPNWPPRGSELEAILGKKGGELLVQTIPKWIAGSIAIRPQNHTLATFSKKISKQDAELDLNDPATSLRKIRAFDIWPRAYFVTERNGRPMRVVVTEAHLENEALVIDRVVPEGKRKMSYADFTRGQK
ncbi:MAG: methionyl-tRNA formyltransferase [Patescibacteria group bacterium]